MRSLQTMSVGQIPALGDCLSAFICAKVSRGVTHPDFCWTERTVYRSDAFAIPITDPVGRVMRTNGF